MYKRQFILYAIVFGVETARRVAPDWLVRTGVAAGGLLFGGTGVASLFLGGNYLNYSVLEHDPVAGQHLGILLVELGVGITVASVMMLVFFVFAGRRR